MKTGAKEYLKEIREKRQQIERLKERREALHLDVSFGSIDYSADRIQNSPKNKLEEAAERPLGRGGWEAAGAEDRHLRGRAGLSSAWDRGEALLSERGRVWCVSGVGCVCVLYHFPSSKPALQ